MKTATPVNTTDERVKQPNCRHGESLSGLDRRTSQPQHSFKPKLNPQQGSIKAEGVRKLQKKSVKLAEGGS